MLVISTVFYRQELKSLYCERFGSVYHNWLVEMDRTRDQEEYFSVSSSLS